MKFKIFSRKYQLFPWQAISNISFFRNSAYTRDTAYGFCFDLDNSLTRWKRTLFKIHYSRNSKVSVLKTNFFPRQAIPKIPFFLCSSYTEDTAFRVWFDFYNSLIRSKRHIYKLRYSRNSKLSVRNTNFIPRQAIAKIPIFLHTTQGILHTLVQFRQLFDPMKKT